MVAANKVFNVITNLKDPINNQKSVKEYTDTSIIWNVNPNHIAPWKAESTVKKETNKIVINFPTDEFGSRPWQTSFSADIILDDKLLENKQIKVDISLTIISPGKSGEVVVKIPNDAKCSELTMKGGQPNVEKFTITYKEQMMDPESAKQYLYFLEKFYLMYGVYPAILAIFVNWFSELVKYTWMDIEKPITPTLVGGSRKYKLKI
jgi:hypothetical protein